MVVLDVVLEMIGEPVDAGGEERDLDFGRTGVALGALVLRDDLRLVGGGDGHGFDPDLRALGGPWTIRAAGPGRIPGATPVRGGALPARAAPMRVCAQAAESWILARKLLEFQPLTHPAPARGPGAPSPSARQRDRGASSRRRPPPARRKRGVRAQRHRG